MCFRTLLVCSATWLAATWLAAPLGAQYTAPGESIGEGDAVESEQGLRASLEDARWRLGVLRLEPPSRSRAPI